MLTGSGYDFNLLFENKTVGIVIVNSKGQIIEANVYAGMLFGYTPCELKQINVDQLVPDSIREAHVAHRQDFAARPRTRAMGTGYDLHGQRKDGSVFPIEISLSPFEKDGLRMVTAFIMDITLRKENEQKIKKQNEELAAIKVQLEELNIALEKKVSDRTKILQETLYELENSRNELTEALEKEKELGELKSRFVSMASHEFRTPLAAVLSSANLMNRYIDGGQPEKCMRHIQRIKSSVDHLNNVLEDFLSLGKIEEGRINIQNTEFNLCHELETLMTDMQEIAKPGQKINFKRAENDTCTLRGDRQLLRNAMINLVSNAIKFSEEGKVIEIVIEREPSMVQIKVADQGLGIPEEEQKHLFDRFFRASNVSNISGTGLGLYIVKRYIEMMKGSLSFISVHGKGTTFTIQLPA
jgi:PAS domain S-box-containing protein